MPGQKGYVDPLLSNVLLDYTTAALMGVASNKIFPRVPIVKSDARYARYGRDNLLVPESAALADNGGYPRRVGGGKEMVPVNATSKGFYENIDLGEAWQNDAPFRPEEERAAKRVATKLMLDEERTAVNVLRSGAGNSDQLVGDGTGVNNKWSGGGGSPLVKALEMRKSMIMAPNLAVCGRDVAFALEENPAISTKLGELNQAKLVTNDILASLFRVDDFHVAAPFIAGARENKTVQSTEGYNPEYLWNGLFVYAYVNPLLDNESLTAGATFYVAYPEVDNSGWMVTIVPDALGGVRGSTAIKVSGEYDTKIMCDACLFVLRDVV